MNYSTLCDKTHASKKQNPAPPPPPIPFTRLFSTSALLKPESGEDLVHGQMPGLQPVDLKDETSYFQGPQIMQPSRPHVLTFSHSLEDCCELDCRPSIGKETSTQNSHSRRGVGLVVACSASFLHCLVPAPAEKKYWSGMRWGILKTLIAAHQAVAESHTNYLRW